MQFGATCIPASRLFFRRMIGLLSNARLQTGRIKLTLEFRLDLGWWAKFLPEWNGMSSFFEVDWTKSDILNLFTDASATHGFASYFRGQWFQSRWPKWLLERGPSIEFLSQFLPGVNFGPVHFFRRKNIFQCDSLGVSQAWEKLGSCCVLAVRRAIFFISAAGNFYLNC